MKKFIFSVLIFMQSFACFSSSCLTEGAAAYSEECLYLQSHEGEIFAISFEAARLVFLEMAIDWKEFIIPQTVPNKPINGAVEPTEAKKV